MIGHSKEKFLALPLQLAGIVLGSSIPIHAPAPACDKHRTALGERARVRAGTLPDAWEWMSGMDSGEWQPATFYPPVCHGCWVGRPLRFGLAS